MSLKRFLAEGRLKPHRTGPKEIRGSGHHWVTFSVVPELLGREYQDLANYFDYCRNKRNLADYDRAGEISAREAEELLEEAKKFRASVLDWLKAHHPKVFPR